MKKSKVVMWECTWSGCKLVIPEGDARMQKQKQHKAKRCPECGSAMQRRVYK